MRQPGRTGRESGHASSFDPRVHGYERGAQLATLILFHRLPQLTGGEQARRLADVGVADGPHRLHAEHPAVPGVREEVGGGVRVEGRFAGAYSIVL